MSEICIKPLVAAVCGLDFMYEYIDDSRKWRIAKEHVKATGRLMDEQSTETLDLLIAELSALNLHPSYCEYVRAAKALRVVM